MSGKNSLNKANRIVHTKRGVIDFSTPKIMGILNLTPDSFYDGGLYLKEDYQVRHTEEMLAEGADIIDVGGVSSRPGSGFVDEQEEMQRIVPAVKRLRKHFPDTVISIDTFRSEVAKACIGEGADMINDISGGTLDRNMFSTVAHLKVPYILMHIHGTPQTMQLAPLKENIVSVVKRFFEEKLEQLTALGANEIILDPGFGFGKTLECNYRILKELESLKTGNRPLLVGVSRKSMINKVLGTHPVEALNGTTAVHVLALLNGADILRVHDVKEAKEAVKVVQYYRELGDTC